MLFYLVRSDRIQTSHIRVIYVREPPKTVLDIVLFASPSLIMSFVSRGKPFFVLRDGIPRSE